MRSYAARGINVEPTVHMGKQATAMMRRGEVSEMQEAQDEARARSAEILRINPEKAIAVVERGDRGLRQPGHRHLHRP